MDIRGEGVLFSNPPKTFTREATGLVREISVFEYFMLNLNSVIPLFAPAFTAWFIWYAVPGGSVRLATVGAFLFGAFGYLAAFALMSASYPRSAAPYVATSRIIHPSIGWSLDVMVWLQSTLFIGIIPASYLVGWGIAPGLYVYGVMTGNSAVQSFAAWAGSPVGVLAIGTIFLIVTVIPSIISVRASVRHLQTPLFVLSMLGTVLTVGILLSSSHTQFVSAFKQLEPNLQLDNLVPMAKQLNPGAFVPVSFAFGTLAAALGMTIGTTNSYWGSWVSGEVKGGASVRNQLLAMLIPGVILLSSVLAIITLEEIIAGRDVLIALTQIGSLAGSNFQNPLFSGGIVTISIPYMLAGNPTVVLVLLICILAAAGSVMPYAWIAMSRSPFAWSFDRLIPEKFASVSDRFHTPVFTILVALIVTEAWLVLAATTQYLGLLFTVTWVWGSGGPAILCLACALLPLRKQLWEQSAARKYQILGIPLASICGILGFLYLMNGELQYTFTPALGWGAQQTYIIGGSYLAVFLLYFVIRFIRQRQNISLDMLFRTIPPE